MEYSLFGCKVNKFYLNKWLQYFQKYGTNGKRVHLIASCVVTDRAKSKWIKLVKKLLLEGKHVYLTGCGAFDKGEVIDYTHFFEIYPELLTWKDQLTLLGEDPEGQTNIGLSGEYELNKEIDQDHIEVSNLYTKKFLVIQSGCDTYCTFCLTIYKRGPQRNRPLEDIIDEIQQFVDNGGKEIVITGVNLASWGAHHTRKPGTSRFSSLLETILLRTTIPRIRISSLGPEFLDDHFFDVVCNERILPHFHFSIQHFDDNILYRMNRNYTSTLLDTVLTRMRSLHRSDISYMSIGADLIVGFPGETDDAFQKMVHAVDRYGITKLHAFPFSPHLKGETVPAGKLDQQVSSSVKKERMQVLLAQGNMVRGKFILLNKNISRPVLLEEQKKRATGSVRVGWTPNYIQREISGDYARGDIIEVI